MGDFSTTETRFQFELPTTRKLANCSNAARPNPDSLRNQRNEHRCDAPVAYTVSVCVNGAACSRVIFNSEFSSLKRAGRSQLASPSVLWSLQTAPLDPLVGLAETSRPGLPRSAQ